jgi:DNA polymerase-1
MKRVRCPKCDSYITFDETKYTSGQSLVFKCNECGKEFGIRIGVSKLRSTQKEESKELTDLDKDFKTIPCKFHRAGVAGKDKSEKITPEVADWWFMYQTLIGDRVDGYEGCKGIGDKTARKILGEAGEKTLAEMWQLVVETYKSKGFSEKDALKNARMARILRAEDYDFKNKEIKLWKI